MVSQSKILSGVASQYPLLKIPVGVSLAPFFEVIMAVWVHIKEGDKIISDLVDPNFLQHHLDVGYVVDKNDLITSTKKESKKPKEKS